MLTVTCNLFLMLLVYTNSQICEEELTERGISVIWHRSPPANNVLSDPICYNKERLITRDCKNTNWTPILSELEPCLQVVKHYDLLACPPGFEKISENNEYYCYQISKTSPWNYPCFKSGGAPLITDLSEEDVSSLLELLRTKNVSSFFWLPARRPKIFNPVRWHIPGPKWGWQVEANNSLRIKSSLLKNCLLLDIHQNVIITEACSSLHPSLCFYINDAYNPVKCLEEYHAFRFMPDDGVCYGIEQSDKTLTFDEFLSKKCATPMGNGRNDDLSRFIFKKISEINKLPENMWCWFTRNNISYEINALQQSETQENNLTKVCDNSEVIINNAGTLRLNLNRSETLSCMACEVQIIYGQPELIFEYSVEEQLMYLTVYFPSGLWKHNQYDRGIQCFSNAKGFVDVIYVNDLPFIEIKSNYTELAIVEKIVYIINLVTDRSAQYWCEGHTKNFSLITTEKIVVSPQGNKEHVFSLVIKTYMANDDFQSIEENMMTIYTQKITEIFKAKKVLIMDILEYSKNYLLILFHLHVVILDIYNNDDRNIQSTYESLRNTAKLELMKYNYTFVNISSSLFCLPTTSVDNSMVLEWEMTSIGHIAAPRQFCLQANGLPVKRFCSGSYLLGSFWGDVEGSCDKNYVASQTTMFLYNFVKGQISESDTSRFLTDGLGFVLGDLDLIIPADIYYLSMSLKHISAIAQENNTLIDMGDIENIAWVMDRILSLESNYLRLAQTLNSTNVILDSIVDIMEILSHKKKYETGLNFRTDNKDPIECVTTLAIQPQCVIQISYPQRNNVSGIAIINELQAENFTEMQIKPLYKNSTIDDVLSMNNLEVAAWLPDYLLNSLTRKSNQTANATMDEDNLFIIINVFYSDAIFQELDENGHRINSRIIGISIPDYIVNLKSYVPLVFKNLKQTNSDNFCGYWDFEVNQKGNIPGFWSNRGCYHKKSVKNLTACECYHLTHFGNLFNIGNNIKDHNANENHTKALNIITLIGSFLSLMGIACIWITATVFHSWRNKAGTKVLLHLSAAIAMPLLFIVVFNLDNTIFVEQNGVYHIYDHMKIVCIVLGAFLHYSILSSFTWMLITAILQFIRYVRVLGARRPSRFMLKLTIIGWGLPIIPVLIVLHINSDNYIPDLSSCYNCSICYPKGIYLILSVVVPICIILFINVTLFVLVLCSISKGPDGKMRTTDLDLIGAQLRLSLFLFFLLGLTWVFGIVSFSSNLIWSYLFCLTSSLQGFVLFVYFIICDPNTRNLWVTFMKPQFRTNLSRESITSISSG